MFLQKRRCDIWSIWLHFKKVIGFEEFFLQCGNLLAKEFRCGPETSLQLLVASPVTVQLTLAPKLVQTKVRQLEHKPSRKSGKKREKVALICCFCWESSNIYATLGNWTNVASLVFEMDFAFAALQCSNVETCRQRRNWRTWDFHGTAAPRRGWSWALSQCRWSGSTCNCALSTTTYTSILFVWPYLKFQSRVISSSSRMSWTYFQTKYCPSINIALQ